MDYKHSCVVDAEGFYKDIILQHYREVYSPPPLDKDGIPDWSQAEPVMAWVVDTYVMEADDRLIDTTPPTMRPHTGADGLIRPRWDDDVLAWMEGATAEETAVWEAEHPAPEPQPMSELTMTQLAVAELAQAVEDNNTANQLAIAELAEAMMGGDPDGEAVL